DAKEAARLAEAAIAAALRERLRNADAELTALSLRLEEARKEAEETLALLAAADAAEEGLNARLAETVARLELAEGLLAEAEAGRDGALSAVAAREASLSDALAALARSEAAGAETAASLAGTRERLRDAAAEAEQLREALAAALAARLAAEGAGAAAVDERDRRQALLDAAGRRLAAEREISSRAQREVALLNAQVAALRGQLAELSRLLDGAAARDRASRVRIDALGSRLNQALARVAAEQRRRAALEAAEAARLRRAKAALDEEVVDLAAYRSEFFGTLRRVLGDREGVRIVGDRFLFSSEVLFESGSATLRPEGRASIAEVAGILEEVADEIPANLDWVLRVDGHTDSAPVVVAGAFADNWELSAGRALSVVKYMTGTLGFPPERLAAAGFGEYRPVNPEDTDAARAQNRRIELKLTER
ncbi:MAG: peptidoglycan -binding protein, partial [Boseongicola sp. SB0675_bin_26]|nr:peptidoglycan -binding protein [Boseongicola sp. SB0675_bin_26]